MPSSSKPKVANLGKIGDARLDLVPALADCKPGIRPVEYNVIVAPVPSTEVEGKIGSIFIPDESKETLDLAMQVGRIIAQSPLAYDYAKWPDDSLKPKVGQIVWFARYGGKEFEGADGKMYRILKDKDIGAVIEERFEWSDPAKAIVPEALNGAFGQGGSNYQQNYADFYQHTLSKTGT